jgi:hypothetical protein
MKPSQRNFFSRVATVLRNALPSQFSRDGATFTPWITLCTLLNLMVPRKYIGYGPMLDELALYNGRNRGIVGENQKGTLTRARYKFSKEMMDAALNACSLFCRDILGSLQPLVYGKQIVAIDGCRMNCPISKKNRKKYGTPNCGGGQYAEQPQVLLVTVTDVVTRLVICRETVPCTGNERKLGQRLIQLLPKNVVVLMDAGFPAHYLLKEFHALGLPYIIRMSGGKTAWKATKNFMKKRLKDEVVTLKDKGETYEARMIRAPGQRGRPRKGTHKKTMYLLTNLHENQWTRNDVALLYRSRWGIETGFREMKHVLSLHSIHARKPEGVEQEIDCACLLMMLIATAELLALHAHDKPITGALDKNGYRVSRISIGILLAAALRDYFIGIRVFRAWQQMLDLGKRAKLVILNRYFERKCKAAFGIWKIKQRRRA